MTTYTDPIGPESRNPIMGTSLFHPGQVQIGWAYLTPSGWPLRAEISDASWLNTIGLPGKALRREPVRAPYSIALGGAR